MIFFQADLASHIGTGTVSAAATLALSEAVRYFVRKDREKKHSCDAGRIEAQNTRHQEENREVLRDIRDGINKMVTMMERER